MIWHDPKWWFVILMALAWWFPQNAIHEGSHALIYKLLGYKITDLKPYLHRHTTTDDEGNPLPWYKGWSFARMWCEWPEDRPVEEKPSQKWRALAVIAPVISNTVIFAALYVPTAMSETWLHGVLGGLMITQLFDAGNNWRFIWRKYRDDSRSDVWRFIYKSGASHKGMIAFSIGWVVLAVAALAIPVSL